MRYVSEVSTLAYDPAKCRGCRRCTEVCPHGVFAMDGTKAIVTDSNRCMECGACALNCAFGAIAVDAGVGCAAALIDGILRYGNPDKGTCDCGPSGTCC